MLRSFLVALLILMPLVLLPPTVRAEQGPMAEIQLGADIGSPFPWPTGSVLLGWRLFDRWSAGVSYTPWRIVFQEMRQGNDYWASPIMLSGLHAVGDFWYKTGSAWGGKAGIHLGALTPYLGVAEPGDDMSGAVAEGLLSAAWGYMGTFLSCQAFAKAGWKWGRLENNTHERSMVGDGPVIVDRVDVSDPTFMTGLALAVWF